MGDGGFNRFQIATVGGCCWYDDFVGHVPEKLKETDFKGTRRWRDALGSLPLNTAPMLVSTRHHGFELERGSLCLGRVVTVDITGNLVAHGPPLHPSSAYQAQRALSRPDFNSFIPWVYTHRNVWVGDARLCLQWLLKQPGHTPVGTPLAQTLASRISQVVKYVLR